MTLHLCIEHAECPTTEHFHECPRHANHREFTLLQALSNRIPNGGYVGDLRAMSRNPEVLTALRTLLEVSPDQVHCPGCWCPDPSRR